MGFLQSVKCATGFHDWSDWSSKSYNDCSQTRDCKVSGCRGHESRNNHDWTDFEFTDNDSCDKSRYCRDCSKVQNLAKVQHQWSDNDWEYEDESSRCDQTRECSRCHERETRLRHLWGVWQQESPASDRLVRFCRRCVTGREVKDPGPIYCVPTIDIGWHLLCVAQIRNITPLQEDPGWLMTAAKSLVLSTERHGCKLQTGHAPRNPSSDYDYFTWEWNDDKKQYDILRWDRGHWQCL
jgi:hypothetical protein